MRGQEIFLITYLWTVGAKQVIELQKCNSFDEQDSPIWTPPSSMMSDSSGNTEFRLVSGMLDCIQTSHYYDIPINPLSPGERLESTSAFPSTTFESLDERRQLIPEKNENRTGIIITEDKDYQEPTTSSTDFEIKPQIQFTPRGFLSIGHEYFRPNEYCFERITDGKLSLTVCEVSCNNSWTPCIPICCSLDKIIFRSEERETCKPSGGKQYTPTFYETVQKTISSEEQGKIQPHFFQHHPHCDSGSFTYSFPFREFHGLPWTNVRVLRDGRVKYFHTIERRWKDASDVCLSGLQSLQEESSTQYSGDEGDQIIYFCRDWEAKEVVAPHFYLPVYFLSSFFLFCTAVVYIALWERQNVHGWSVLSFVFSFFFMLIFLGSSHGLSSLVLEDNRSFLCVLLGIITHFFFLATFCWITVINFDLWWTFKSMDPVPGRSKGIKRFIIYMIFGWGSPTIVVTIGLSLTHAFPDPLSEVRIPGYGYVNCFIEQSVKGIYLYYIIGGLMGINLGFMVLTLVTMCKFKEGTRAVDAARSNNTQSLTAKLFFKLIVIMGVSWVFEVISWWQIVEETLLYWVIFDILNILQSIGVFIIFVCKRKILNQLKQKYPSLKVITGPLKKCTTIQNVSRSVTATSTTRTQTTTFSLKRFQRISQTQKNPETLVSNQQNRNQVPDTPTTRTTNEG